ncbi:MAG: alpha/beta hydrolase, partial [Bacteroidetes bacterium]|nr:alpha/beta hydrolase [Bacteroidota bacterium]
MPTPQHTTAKNWVQRMTRWMSYDLNRISIFRAFVNSGSWFFRPPEDITTIDVMLGHLPIELVVPKELKLDGVLLYFHGGGYCLGSLGSHRGWVGKIAIEAGIKVAHIDYRLAPEHPYPAAEEDAVAAYQWLLQKGMPPEKIIFGGDSAGGGLVISTLNALKAQNLPLPKAAFCLSPWVDLSFSGKSAVKNAQKDPIIPVPKVHYWALAYAGDLPLEHPGPSPLYADLSDLPPILIQASDSEVLTDDAQRLAKKIEEAGGDVTLQIWPGVLHVWQFLWR